MFRDVDVAKLKLLAMASNRVSLEAGEALLRQGDAPDAVYVLLQGEADVFRETPKGEVHLARITAGEVVGEIGALCGRPYSATIKAAGELVALRVERNSFVEILEEVPQLALAISRELGLRLERMNERFATLTTQ
jgi:CRP-like cAMP-binding protein